MNDKTRTERPIPTITEETMFSQLCDELQNTLFYDDHGKPLRSMTMTRQPFKKISRFVHWFPIVLMSFRFNFLTLNLVIFFIIFMTIWFVFPISTIFTHIIMAFPIFIVSLKNKSNVFN